MAGFFGMRIYMVNLNNTSTTEDDLVFLFASLLEQCFVLLKDVDYAGHTRARDLHANVPPSRDTACHSRSQPRISYFHPGAYSLVGLSKCA